MQFRGGKVSSGRPNISPGLMVEPLDLDPPHLLGVDPDRRRGQVVVLSSNHQRGEDWRAVSSASAPLCHRRTVGRLLLAKGGHVALNHRLDAMHRLHPWCVSGGGAEGGLQEVLVVQSAVGHGAVEAANGPDAHGKGFGLQGASDISVSLTQQRSERRRRSRSGRVKTLRLRLVESPPLLGPHSLELHHRFCQN